MTDEVVLDMDATNQPIAEASQETAVQEDMLPKSRVEELVKKAKLKGRDSMQAELDALKAENQALKTNGSMGGMAAAPAVDQEAIERQVMERIEKKFQESNQKREEEEKNARAQNVANTYFSKMSNGSEHFDDFDKVVSDFNPAAHSNLVALVSEMDNVPHIMHDLITNPSKLANASFLAERDPRAAQSMLAKLGESIRTNQQAKAMEKDAPAPISRMSSSVTGQDDGKVNSLRDFKANPRYRG